jgi:hypothetical protein
MAVSAKINDSLFFTPGDITNVVRVDLSPGTRSLTVGFTTSASAAVRGWFGLATQTDGAAATTSLMITHTTTIPQVTYYFQGACPPSVYVFTPVANTDRVHILTTG